MSDIARPRKPMSTANLKQRIAEQDAEIIALRAALGMEKTEDVGNWAIHCPQHLRDQMAATALIAEKLDEPRALQRLGFELRFREGGQKNHLDPVVWKWCEQVFGTPGVKAILAESAEGIAGSKDAIINRMTQIAKHGDEKSAVAAGQVLGRIGAWFEGDKAVAAAGAPRFSVLQYLGNNGENGGRPVQQFDPDKTVDGMVLLDHEVAKEGVLVQDSDDEGGQKRLSR